MIKLPLLADLRRSNPEQLGADLLAGTLTAVLLVPQALAYALLAGLPLQVGLYASILPALVYAVLGSSRTLAVGPVAVAAVMVAEAIAPIANGDAQLAVQAALLLAALSGLILLAMAVLRLGWLTQFVSHPVLSGFTTGAALLIIGSQLPALTGITTLPTTTPTQPEAWLHQLSLPTVALSVVSLLLLWSGRTALRNRLERLGVSGKHAQLISRLLPLALVIAASLLMHWSDGAQRWHIAVVGAIPAGLPALRFDGLALERWPQLLPAAVMIAVIGYVESIAVAKALAYRRHQKINANQELLALGSANLAAALSGAMPVAGGFSRSIVNFDAGARSQLASVVTAMWVALVAWAFSGTLSELPKAVLAAIIVVAVAQLIDFGALRRTWSYDRNDALAQALSMAGVVALGIEWGLLLGVGAALALFLYRSSRPHIAELGQVPHSEHFRNPKHHRVLTWPPLMLLRIDENIYFANALRVESEILERAVERPQLKAVILVLSSVSYIDSSGLETLERIEHALADIDIELHLAEVKWPVARRLRNTALWAALFPRRSHLSAQQAVNAVLAQLGGSPAADTTP